MLTNSIKSAIIIVSKVTKVKCGIERCEMVKLILKDSSEIIGTIDRETESYYMIDEDVAFGDIVAIKKEDVKEIRRM